MYFTNSTQHNVYTIHLRKALISKTPFFFGETSKEVLFAYCVHYDGDHSLLLVRKTKATKAKKRNPMIKAAKPMKSYVKSF